MAKDILNTLNQCEVYEKFQKSKAPEKSVIPRADGAPYEQWAIDVVGPMPGSTKKRFIITAVDYCTRWPVAQATQSHDSPTIRRFIGKEISAKFGTPKRIVSDQGTEFMLTKTQDYFSLDQIDHLPTTLYHPQANGQVEHLNGALLQILKKLSIENPKLWYEHLILHLW